MMNPLFFLAAATVACAQIPLNATFYDLSSGPFIEGVNYTLQWTVGNGLPVSAELWSGNYSQPIFSNLAAGSSYTYTIPPVAEGSYSIELLQGGVQSDASGLFSIFNAPLNTSGSATTTIAAATCTGALGKSYVYYDEYCGCTKTAMAPIATSASNGTNYNAPLTTPVLPGTYTGAASSLHGGCLVSFIFGAALLAVLE